jgi:F0F1-type ATP synthase epsilon subunit
MQLKIVKPTQTQNFDIEWLEINTQVGNFLIQPEHAPMIVALAFNSDVKFLIKNSKQGSFKASQGIAHIERDLITLLIID